MVKQKSANSVPGCLAAKLWEKFKTMRILPTSVSLAKQSSQAGRSLITKVTRSPNSRSDRASEVLENLLAAPPSHQHPISQTFMLWAKRNVNYDNLSKRPKCNYLLP